MYFSEVTEARRIALANTGMQRLLLRLQARPKGEKVAWSGHGGRMQKKVGCELTDAPCQMRNT